MSPVFLHLALTDLRACTTSAGTQQATACNPNQWIHLLTERWYLGGVGRIILYGETEGGDEVDSERLCVCVCVCTLQEGVCVCVCVCGRGKDCLW